MVDCHIVCPTLLYFLSVFERCYLWIVGALNHLHPLMVLRLCLNQLPVCPHLNLQSEFDESPVPHNFSLILLI